MKKVILATTAVAALALSLSAARADEPGVEKYFHERGDFDASMMQKGPAPDLAGWPAYQGYGARYDHYNRGGYGGYGGYGEPMGYAPGYGSGTSNW